MLTSVANLVQHTAERLRSELGIEVGLDEIVESAGAARNLDAEATSVRRRLKKRVRALEEAQTELLSLIKTVEHLEAVLPFMEEGWPSQLERLRGLADGDPTAAIGAWLQYWFETIGSYRLGAAHRLVQEAPLPEGAWLISERATLAAAGLEQRDWNVAVPILLAGVDGVHVGAKVVPTPEVQASLRRLLVRLALLTGQLDEADRLLGDGLSREDTAADLALRARRYDLADDKERARSLLVEAQSANPGDLDVVVELIRQGRKTMELEGALEIARVGADALPSLLDLDSDLGRLLEPPTELWIALSYRAQREDMPDLVVHALDAADRLARFDEHELRAVIAECRAEVASSATERVRALRDAGDERQAANDLRRARLNFTKAVEAAGEDVDPLLRASATLRHADMVAVLDAAEPFRQVRDEVADALQRLLDAQAVEGMAVAESWNYLTEVDLRINIVRMADSARADQAWRAFLAASRAVALAPDEGRRWSTLSAAAQVLTCFRTAEAMARHAWEQGGEAEVPTYIQALANLGRIDQAIKLVDATDPWSECVRAYLLLRLGKHEDAIRLLRAVTIDPSWTWARETLLSALLLTGQFEEARVEAEAFARIAAERMDEANFLFTMAFYELVQGRLDSAAELARRCLASEQGFGEGDAAGLLGAVLLLRGDRDAGLQIFEQSVSCFRDRKLDDWSRIDRPLLEILARDRDVSIGDPGALETMVARRREKISATSDPLAELAQAATGTADAGVVRSARALGTVLLHLAAGDEARVHEALAEIGAGFEDEASSLRGHLRSRADERRHAEMAARAVQLSSTGDRTAALTVLGHLLDETPYEADTLLRRNRTSEELKPVAEVLMELASDPRYEGSATDVLRWLDLAQPEPETSTRSDLQVRLPSSWFADYADPVSEHPLFLRYLPELRARVDWEVPAVRVIVENALEPDGYRISTDGELLDEGRIPPEALFCRNAALEFLPPDLRSAATSDPDLALSWLPAAAVRERCELVDLLTMPTIEVVVRLVGEAARRLAERQTSAT